MKAKGIHREDIINLRNQGLCCHAIASKLSVADNVIKGHLRRIELGIPPLVKYNHNQIIELYKSGLSTLKIAKLLGALMTSIHNHIMKEGIARSPTEAAQLGSHFGIDNPAWKGGRCKDGKGYILVLSPGHHRANHMGYVREHILVWEEYHHKQLPHGYVIHHLNGINDDNRVENLVAMKAGAHSDLAEPYKKKIRQLEIENRQLRHALEDSQMIFYMGTN